MRDQKYMDAFETILGEVPDGDFVWCDVVLIDPRLPEASSETRKSKLRKYLDQHQNAVEKVRGIYPSPSTLVALTQQKLGQNINEENLFAANKLSSMLVGEISVPILKKFLSDNLAGYYKDEKIEIPTTELIRFMMNELSEFYTKAGNSLVSIAGSLNEQLLEQAMKNQGMTEANYKRTGKNSEGDFVIYSSAGNRAQIGVEVKSYHARERLLRGLQDITAENKVGFGYFIDAAEFNKQRTVTLLQSNAAAIYMPAETLNNVEESARNMTSNKQISFQHRFYRPIERFVTDMKAFCNTGRLPEY